MDLGDAPGVMVIIITMVTQVQNLDEAVCISYGANTLVKGINPTILLSVISKY